MPLVTLGVGAGGAGISNSFLPGERVFVGLHQSTDAVLYLLGSDLSLTLDVDDNTPEVGQSITFTVALSNVGPDHIVDGVEVSAALPSGLTFGSATASNGSYDNVTGIWSVGQLDNLANPTLSVTATVSAVGERTMTAEVSASGSSDIDSNPGNDVDSEDDQASVTYTPRSADLSLELLVNRLTPNVGDVITYQIRLANAGPDVVTASTVSDALPAGVTYQSHDTEQGTYDSGTGLWSVPVLVPGSSFVLRIDAQVDVSTPVTNVAELMTSDTADPDSTPGNGVPSEDDQQSVTIAPTIADLGLTKVVDDSTPNLGQTVNFTVTLSNNGPNDATSVVVTDVLPAGLAFVSSTPSVGTYTSGTGVWAVGALANGANATLGLAATVTTTGTFNNTASITGSDTADSDPSNNSASVSLTTQEADLSLTKSVDEDRPQVGDTVTFTLALSNGGPDDATNVQVTDSLPSGLTFVSANPSGEYNSGTGVWSAGTVSAGTTDMLTISATVDSLGDKVNTAEVTASDVFDPDSTPGNGSTTEDDLDSATVSPRSADISVTKTASNGTPFIGSEITYTVTLNNDGPDSALGVVVTDLLPANLTYQSSVPSLGTYDAGTGLWTVGTVDAGSAPTLDIVVVVENTTSTITNTAELTASNTADPDSTPNNGNGAEDDQASVGIVPQEIDAEMTVIIGELITIVGTPNGTVGLYEWVDGHWVLVDVVTLDGTGFGISDVTAQPDTTYGVGSPDGTVPPDAGTEISTVPTLGEWGMIFFVLLLMAAALVSMRRQRLA